MKHIKKYTKFVVFYLLISFVSYLITTIVLARLPAVIRDSIITFAVFLIFNFLLIPISATKEVLLISNKYSTRTLAITTLVSVILILISSTLLTNSASFLPYTLNSINQNELADPIKFAEIPKNIGKAEYIFHTSLAKLNSEPNSSSIHCSTNIYDIDTNKLDLYFPTNEHSEVFLRSSNNHPKYTNITLCYTNDTLISIVNEDETQSTDKSVKKSYLYFYDLNKRILSEKSINIDSSCYGAIFWNKDSLYFHCNRNVYNPSPNTHEDYEELYQVNLKTHTSKKLYSCKSTLVRETCVDQNNTKYYDKTWTTQ